MPAAALLSSDRDDWCTPGGLLRLVRQVGPICLDPCGNPGSIVHAVREYRLDRGEDGLRLPWAVGGLCFVNPPYGDAIGAFTRRMAREGAAGVEIIGLLPARVDTAWWQRDVVTADAICFWSGRLKFLGARDSAPFPSAIAYWGPQVERFVEVFAPYGWAVRGGR